MATALWITAPYIAFLSLLAGVGWRLRHDRLRRHEADRPLRGRLDNAARMLLGATMICIIAARIAEVAATRDHRRAVPAPILAVETLAAALALVAAALVLLPDILSATPQRPVTPLDRATIPLLIAALFSGMLIGFDHDPTDTFNRAQDTLFVWLPAAFTTHPHPEAMVRAPLVFQIRGLVVVTIIAVLPYTRLAEIISDPLITIVSRLTPRPKRPTNSIRKPNAGN